MDSFSYQCVRYRGRRASLLPQGAQMGGTRKRRTPMSISGFVLDDQPLTSTLVMTLPS